MCGRMCRLVVGVVFVVVVLVIAGDTLTCPEKKIMLLDDYPTCEILDIQSLFCRSSTEHTTYLLNPWGQTLGINLNLTHSHNPQQESTVLSIYFYKSGEKNGCKEYITVRSDDGLTGVTNDWGKWVYLGSNVTCMINQL